MGNGCLFWLPMLDKNPSGPLKTTVRSRVPKAAVCFYKSDFRDHLKHLLVLQPVQNKTLLQKSERVKSTRRQESKRCQIM